MLVLCSEWRSGVFLVASVILGLSRFSAAECASSSGSQNISQYIPSCALACVEDFISTQFASGLCCDGTSISCLCQTNTTSGLTLGEGALACTVGSCSSTVISDNGTEVYEICNSVSGALPETHTAITATRLSVVTETSYPVSTTAVSSRSVVSVLPTSSSTALMSSTSTTSAATTTVPPITSIPIPTVATTAITTSASTLTSSAAAASSSSSSALGSPAVIGVSVASGVSAIFLMGILIFFCGRRLRRKRHNEESKEGFEIGGHMSEPPDFTAAALRVSIAPPPRKEGTGNGPNFHQFPSQPVDRQGPLVILTQPGQTTNHKEAGMSPETEYGGSPQSQASQHTISRLLPDTTSPGMVPKPLRIIRRSAAVRPVSEATEFDEEEQRPESIFGPSLEKSQPLGAQNNKFESKQQDYASPVRAIGLPANPRPRPKDQNSYTSPAYSSYKWEKSPAPIPVASQKDRSRANSNLVNKLSPPPGTSPAQYSNGTNSLQRNFSRLGRGLLSPPTQNNTPRSTRTVGGDTSYETIVVEEDWTDKSILSVAAAAPLPPPQLTPVQEKTYTDALPVITTQSPMRYSAIPRSAAIVPAAKVPRRSQAAELFDAPADGRGPRGQGHTNAATESHAPIAPQGQTATFFHDSSSRSRSDSPNSLLAKRRGESVADKMESQFRSGVQPKHTTTTATAIPRKAVRGGESAGRVELESRPARGVVPVPPTPSEAQSPRLAHNITPTRRGEDLYLRVD